MLRSIIVEDESSNRKTLELLLHQYCNHQIVNLNSVGTLEKGIEAWNLHKPDLMFLDIELANGTGFDLLDRLGDISQKVIFVTAYEQYAIRAIRYAAMDYLLKPIDVDELIASVEKASRLKEKSASKEGGEMKLPSIPIHTNAKTELLKIDNILYCRADGAYSQIFLKDEKTIVVSKTLKEMEGILPPAGFLRIHRSYIVNINKIVRYLKKDGGLLETINGMHLPISRRKRKHVLNMIGDLSSY